MFLFPYNRSHSEEVFKGFLSEKKDGDSEVNTELCLHTPSVSILRNEEVAKTMELLEKEEDNLKRKFGELEQSNKRFRSCLEEARKKTAELRQRVEELEIDLNRSTWTKSSPGDSARSEEPINSDFDRAQENPSKELGESSMILYGSTDPIRTSEEHMKSTTGLQILEHVKSSETEADETHDPHRESVYSSTRVSVRLRTEEKMINDGCRWKKYGKKIVKANSIPRDYYRCSMSPKCPVRKKVQRCREDHGVLVSTYEGIHNHDVPYFSEITHATMSALSKFYSSSTTSKNHNSHTFPSSFSSIASTSSRTSRAFPTITLDLSRPSNQMQLAQPPINSSSLAEMHPHGMCSLQSPEFCLNMVTNIKADPRIDELITSAIVAVTSSQQKITNNSSSDIDFTSSLFPH